jgi:antitoxin MazE
LELRLRSNQAKITGGNKAGKKIYKLKSISLKENTMQVSKWGNSLAVRFPASLVQALDLKEGEEVELHMVEARTFEVSKKAGAKELLAQLRQFRGRLPADFHFDRFEANTR